MRFRRLPLDLFKRHSQVIRQIAESIVDDRQPEGLADVLGSGGVTTPAVAGNGDAQGRKNSFHGEVFSRSVLARQSGETRLAGTHASGAANSRFA